MRGSLLKLLLLVATVLVVPTSAHAFYWAGWPGSGVYVPQSITPQQIPIPPTTPKSEPPPSEPPKETPEPATLVIAGLGLGMLGLRKVLKRKK